MESVFLGEGNFLRLTHVSRVLIYRGRLFVVLFVDWKVGVGNNGGLRSGPRAGFDGRRRGRFFGVNLMTTGVDRFFIRQEVLGTMT